MHAELADDARRLRRAGGVLSAIGSRSAHPSGKRRHARRKVKEVDRALASKVRRLQASDGLTTRERAVGLGVSAAMFYRFIHMAEGPDSSCPQTLLVAGDASEAGGTMALQNKMRGGGR